MDGNLPKNPCISNMHWFIRVTGIVFYTFLTSCDSELTKRFEDATQDYEFFLALNQMIFFHNVSVDILCTM